MSLNLSQGGVRHGAGHDLGQNYGTGFTLGFSAELCGVAEDISTLSRVPAVSLPCPRNARDISVKCSSILRAINCNRSVHTLSAAFKHRTLAQMTTAPFSQQHDEQKRQVDRVKRLMPGRGHCSAIEFHMPRTQAFEFYDLLLNDW